MDIDNGIADIVTVGSMALADPDLVEHIRAGAPPNTPDPATFYGGGAAGYTDYPTYAARPERLVLEEVAFLGRFGVRTTQSGTGVPAVTSRSRRAAPIQTRPTSHDQGIPGEGILVEADHAGRRAVVGPVEASHAYSCRSGMPSRRGRQGTTPSGYDRTTGKGERVRDTAGGGVEAGVRDVVVAEGDRGALGISRRGVRHVATTTNDLPSEGRQSGRSITCRP
jgi:hypothetical protein